MLRNKLIFFIVAFVCVLSFASCNNNTEETSYNGEKSLSLVEETSYESEFFFSSPKYKATVQSLSENTHQYAMGEIAIDHGDIYYINGSGAGIEKISEDGKIHEWVVKDFV
ncbi:MAG: hypothetical protein KAH01_04460, partial [Caldisericia bacterium]|nr:hypothetical protein [Caldisericia bacterium]